MRHQLLRQTRGTSGSRRVRSTTAADHEQYSLFAATPSAPAADARYFHRQALLCERLLSGLHQPELVELLGRLHDEFEAKAALVADIDGGSD
jgi:hypothetical protein